MYSIKICICSLAQTHSFNRTTRITNTFIEHIMAAAADHATPTYDRMKEVKEFDESKIGVKGLAESGERQAERRVTWGLCTTSGLGCLLESLGEVVQHLVCAGW